MKKTFYAAKVNVHENIFNQNLEEIIQKLIPDMIKSMPTIKLNTYNVSFTDVEEVIHDNHTLL
jgi:hypothetical protein